MYPLHVPQEVARRRSLRERELNQPLITFYFLLTVLVQYSILHVRVNYNAHLDLLPFLFNECDLCDGLYGYVPSVLFEFDLTCFLVEVAVCVEDEELGDHEHPGLVRT